MKLGERLKHIKLIRSFVYALVGFASYPGLAWVNQIKIEGTEHLENLPKKKCVICKQSPNLFC